MAKPTGPLTEAQLTVLLRERFAAPEYAFIPQVRNGTGYSRSPRTADALAMSLWPSRGLELHGFELKSDRADWIRERTNPEKAEAIQKYCDRWWMVVGAEDIIPEGELFPPTWGLLVPRGGKLVVKREAPKLEAKSLDRLQLAAILRRAAECVVPRAEIQAELDRKREKMEEDLERRVEERTCRLENAHETLLKERTEFEETAGIRIGGWRGEHIGEAVAFVLNGGLKREEERLRGLAVTAREILAALEARLAELPPVEGLTGTGG